MRRSLLAAIPLVSVACILAIAACVGDDATPGTTSPLDEAGGGDETMTTNGDGSPGTDGSSGADGAGTDGGADADAAPPCGYPGEDCCAGGALACQPGTVCGTSNNKCMLNEVGAVGQYLDVEGSTLTEHTGSAFYDGTMWTAGANVTSELVSLGGPGPFAATDLISSAPQDYHVTMTNNVPHGQMLHFSSGAWHPCQVGQSCIGPLTPAPALSSVADISSDIWLGATNMIYRCASSAMTCVNQNAGLESTTWGDGKLVGTGPKDIWFSALTRAFHYDGTTWTIHDNLKALTIYEVRKDDVWVANQTLQHWNGTSWSAEFAIDGKPAPGSIYRISGSSSTDLWAVGYDATGVPYSAFAAHWNGATWTMVGKNLPAGATGRPDVYAPSPLEAYVAANGVFKWNGTTWTQMTMPTFTVGTGSQPGWAFITGPAKPRP